ncbi:MAG: twin-arginine translocase subunit TatC, partial [Bacillota bacterium]
LVLAAVMTPTTDIITQFIFAVPLAALYELGYALCVLIHRRRRSAAGRGRGTDEAGRGPNR